MLANLKPFADLGDQIIYQGDILNTLKQLSMESIDLVVTSPPYNLGKKYETDSKYEDYLIWCRRWLDALQGTLKPGARVCLNIPIDTNRNGKRFLLKDLAGIAAEFQDYIYNTTIIWTEGNVSRRTAWGSWLSASDPWVNTAAETILVLSYKQRKRPDKGISTINREEFMTWTLGIWNFPGARPNGHPAPFPEELPRRLIRLYSYQEDIILDPFVGSGTTLLVARKEGRRGIGIELAEKYCQMTVQRLEGQPARMAGI